ncbi:MAX network transcriptional repressor b [Aplochiton taeniatus]
MSIDTLLEAARYLEWQAQQQQIAREEEQRREKAELYIREAESKRLDAVTSSAQPIGVNHVSWAGNETCRLQQQHPAPPAVPPPPPPSLPPPHLPFAVIPMVPVVATTPSVPPIPLVTPVAAAATTAMVNGLSPLAKNSSPPRLQQPIPRHLLCATHMKLEPNSLTPQTGGSPSQSQPQVHIQYPTSIISTSANASQHALLSQQTPPTTQVSPNGIAGEDMRGLDGKRRPGGAGTREVHNKLEKNRRAHLKECFDTLKKNVPNVDEKKTSNLSVLRSALRYIQTLKRKEKEYEHEMERLAREKISTQQRLSELKKELGQSLDAMEIDHLLRQTGQPEDDQASTSTASEGEDILDQDIDDITTPPLPKPPPPILPAQSLLTSHLSIGHTSLPLASLLNTPTASAPPPQTIAPAPQPHPLHVQPTVIAHAVSHPSVIQAVNHILPANHKHLAHIAPSPGPASSSTPQPMTATAATHHQPMTAQPIGHITVHPVAHLGGPLPGHLQGLYPQGVSVCQPTVVGHITHTFTHHLQPQPPQQQHGPQLNGAAVPAQGGPTMGKPTAVLAPHHPHLVGQTATVLNPVTMVTVPPFPGTLKLA